jgi:hypothetical protein
MPIPFRRSIVLLAGMFWTFQYGLAQETPSLDVLRAVGDNLPHQPSSGGTTFRPSGSASVDQSCSMERFTMTLATASQSARSLQVMLDRRPEDANIPVTLLTVLHRVTVDVDGSPRTYHPDDPHATGTCTRETGSDGKERFSGICALDDFESGHIQVFQGARKLGRGDFESSWKSFWPLIRDKKLSSFNLKSYVPTAPDGYYFFYWAERNLIALFKREIVPDSQDGYPCVSDGGYFVAATSLKQGAVDSSTNCAPSQFIDSEQIPFFVLPDDDFGKARLGDIVVARIERTNGNRVVFGVVGDTGPVAKFGEASVAFNQALLANFHPIVNGHDIWGLDISGAAVTVLLLGGSNPQLGGNFSRRNIEQVGRKALAQWNGDASNPTRRLDACVKQLGLDE